MNIHNLSPILFAVILALVAGTFLVKIFKNGGIRGAMFGAPIRSTVGEVSGSGSRLMNISLKVHRLGGTSEQTVGLEFVAKSVASYQMLPLTLSGGEDQRLVQLIQSALADSSAV